MKEYLKISPVDAHTHLREPGAEYKEDFETGTKAAIAGGYTLILDMPNNPNAPTITPQALKEKIGLAESQHHTRPRIYCDLGFFFGGTAESSQYFEQIKDRVFGLKVYMNHTTGTLLVENLEDLKTIFSKWGGRKPILVHAEEEMVSTAINLARQYHKRLHVCHVARKKEIEMIKAAKNEGLLVTCETAPHYLFLTEADAQALGPFGIMRPPLGTEEDRQALWDNLDVIDIIASDHAPHTREEKLSPLAGGPPFGVPGLETTLPLLLTAVAKDRLSLERLVELISTNPRKIFSLPKETDESYTEIDLTESYLIDPANLKTKCGWTPFEGRRVTGKIVRVVLRGKVVFENGEVKEPAQGRVVYPR